jgi:hypothetical protein
MREQVFEEIKSPVELDKINLEVPRNHRVF